MKLFIVVILTSALTFLSSCVKMNPQELEQRKNYLQQLEQRENPDNISVENSDRITVKRISVISDNMAYRGERGIYVIVDNETGKEYIGVSGIGITETGSHTVSSGKTTSTREHEQ